MDKITGRAALPPDLPPAGSNALTHDDAGCVRLFEFLHTRTPPRRNGGHPLAVPAPLSCPASAVRVRRPRADVLDQLRARIRQIERVGLNDSAPRKDPRRDAVFDGAGVWPPPAALDMAATHELKPSLNSAGATAAAIAFALGLVRRRLDQTNKKGGGGQPRILWCAPQAAGGETGRLYGPGLVRFGLDPSAFIIVETARASETLWAMEEGLKSGAVAMVIGCVDAAGLTPARRLSLAAKERDTPCLMITNAHTAAAGATATRWRICAEPSAAHPLDPQAPGALRLGVSLERCRGLTVSDDTRFSLDWCHDASCFRVAAAVADRQITPSRAHRRAG